MDGLYFADNNCVLISRTPDSVVNWMFVERENTTTWTSFFKLHFQPQVIVIDGQRGLLKAVHDFWPDTNIQRCMVHIQRLALSRLTLHPKTLAGQQLRPLVLSLTHIRTRRQKRKWLGRYYQWRKKYEAFLKEKSQPTNPNTKRKWWYTHKRLRSIRSLLNKSIPNLFYYVSHPNVPRSTNHVESTNSTVKELLRIHRGLPPNRQRKMIALFLRSKTKKPTRNVT